MDVTEAERQADIRRAFGQQYEKASREPIERHRCVYEKLFDLHRHQQHQQKIREKLRELRRKQEETPDPDIVAQPSEEWKKANLKDFKAGGLARMKRDILSAEMRGGGRDVDARRAFNAALRRFRTSALHNAPCTSSRCSRS